MVATLRTALSDEERDEAEARIHEDPLSIEIRGDWYLLGEQTAEPMEFRILLCTGGPAVRIQGELNGHREPEDACIEFQDWGTPWEPVPDVTDAEREAILYYCRQFYFAG